jgi:hypothetical protein
MLQLKKFAVVVWVRKMDTFKSVREQLVSIAKDEPDESTELEGIVDFHWRFDSHPEAERLANSLREISHKPEIVEPTAALMSNDTNHVGLFRLTDGVARGTRAKRNPKNRRTHRLCLKSNTTCQR